MIAQKELHNLITYIKQKKNKKEKKLINLTSTASEMI